MARTATPLADGRLGRLTSGLRRFVAVPFRRRTYLNLAYLLLAFPLGIAYFVFVVTGFSLGIGLSVVLVGIPLLAAVFLVSLALAGFERWLTAALLAVDIEPRTSPDGDDHWEQTRSLLTRRETWTSLLYLPIKIVLGVVSFVLVVTGFSTAIAMLTVPFYYDQPGLYVGVMSDRAPEVHQTLHLGWDYLLVSVEAVFTVGYWNVTTLPQALAVAGLGVVLLFTIFHALNVLARLWGRFARAMLEDGYDPLAVVVRRLGSPTEAENGPTRRGE
ncbi:sensor domain-containing protein [Natronorubrum sp. FCH18a]|uniref:sensor domain-containing protein n=1 Tax=Natronorubrum sp. FCH18a TaxID=3447018 RepID=UPI003F511BB6